MKATITPERAANGQIHQKSPLQVDRSTNAAAKNGPMAFPIPTQEPRMPWYLESDQHNSQDRKLPHQTHLPRFSKETMSETIIMVKAVMPPFPTPEIPRKAYS